MKTIYNVSYVVDTPIGNTPDGKLHDVSRSKKLTEYGLEPQHETEDKQDAYREFAIRLKHLLDNYKICAEPNPVVSTVELQLSYEDVYADDEDTEDACEPYGMSDNSPKFYLAAQDEYTESKQREYSVYYAIHSKTLLSKDEEDALRPEPMFTCTDRNEAYDEFARRLKFMLDNFRISDETDSEAKEVELYLFFSDADRKAEDEDDDYFNPMLDEEPTHGALEISPRFYLS